MMTDTRTSNEKIASYRERYPERVARLTAIVAPLLGVHARTKLSPEAVEACCAPVVDRLIAGAWGFEEPVIPTSVATVP
jgi:hypothetical protein